MWRRAGALVYTALAPIWYMRRRQPRRLGQTPTRAPASGVLGVVTRAGLAAAQCRLLKASSEWHESLNVRMRLDDLAHEQGHHQDAERDSSRVYDVLASTGSCSVRLDVRPLEDLVLQVPVLERGRRVTAAVTCSVRRVRAVVAGLRSSELVHRALLQIAATSD